MGAAIALRDIVGVAQHRLLVGIGPLHGHFHGDALGFGGEVDHRFVQRVFLAAQVLDERADATFVFEHIGFAFLALIKQLDAHAGIQK